MGLAIEASPPRMYQPRPSAELRRRNDAALPDEPAAGGLVHVREVGGRGSPSQVYLTRQIVVRQVKGL